MASTEDKEPLEHASNEEAEESKPGAEEEDTGAEVAPIVKLDAVSVSTGEENEDVLIDLKAKLYRFDKDGNQWKERGMGQVKLLKHKETAKIRLVMRQNKTLKICANHTVLPSITLQEHQGSDKTWVWHASDFADGELKDELFCIRFGNVENAQAFKTAFEDAQKEMSVKLGGDGGEAEKVTELLEELKVVDKEAAKAEGEPKKKAEEPTPEKKDASTEEK
ncbi:hypothetical protein KP509_09G056500 [Ceratopteris richardii]|uniref:RanBD1 domain-containing protein n=1 Tax=Ceratopteris richardii TaxID=49495 RepID=A0A8T2U0G1_CERRI|nr:hypothetical protein KP509_09G056500 [Ceratopteris richardii]